MMDTILFDFVGMLLFPIEGLKANRLVDEIDRQAGSSGHQRKCGNGLLS
jgi:hypothetical protein